VDQERNTVNVVISGTDFAHISPDGLRNFEENLFTLIQEAVAPFGIDLLRRGKVMPPFLDTTIVFKYEASPGATYKTSGGFNERLVPSMDIKASWAIFKPGEALPIDSGEIPWQMPPVVPRWEGKQFPQDILLNAVTEKVKAIFRRDFFKFTADDDGDPESFENNNSRVTKKKKYDPRLNQRVRTYGWW